MAPLVAYADVSLLGRPLPHRRLPLSRSAFGNLALIAFLVAQLLDGVLTYVGVSTFGLGIEANPIVAALMTHLGHGTGLFGAKLLAGMLGVALYLRRIHRAVAVLAAFYFAVAVGPWSVILFL